MTDLAARVQRLEDLDEIRQLKAQYCLYADENSDGAAQKFAALFTKDAILDEGEDLGVVRGRAALFKLHRHFWKGLKLNQHLAFSPTIEIKGDEAHGHWRLLQLIHSVLPEGERAFWACGQYEEVYSRTDEGWRIAHVKASVDFCCPYEDGWAKTPTAAAIPQHLLEGLAAAVGPQP